MNSCQSAINKIDTDSKDWIKEKLRKRSAYKLFMLFLFHIFISRKRVHSCFILFLSKLENLDTSHSKILNNLRNEQQNIILWHLISNKETKLFKQSKSRFSRYFPKLTLIKEKKNCHVEFSKQSLGHFTLSFFFFFFLPRHFLFNFSSRKF